MELDNTAGRTFQCEGCGLTVMLTDHLAYQLGWDYPPFMGEWGVISPRTCGECGVESTAWWALAVDKTPVEQLEERHLLTIERILRERA